MTIFSEPPLLDSERIPIYEEIDIERDNQDRKFGAQRNHIPADWLMILGEEVGEANKSALEAQFGFSDCTESLKQYRQELIQVAAVAVAAIESLDRQLSPEGIAEARRALGLSTDGLPPDTPRRILPDLPLLP